MGGPRRSIEFARAPGIGHMRHTGPIWLAVRGCVTSPPCALRALGSLGVERLLDPLPGIIYPRLIDASGCCPPEDSGGPWGYAELLEAIEDPKHERHAELTEWIGGAFDPNLLDTAAEVQALAETWTRKSSSKRARHH